MDKTEHEDTGRYSGRDMPQLFDAMPEEVTNALAALGRWAVELEAVKAQLTARLREMEYEHAVWEKHSLTQVVEERDRLRELAIYSTDEGTHTYWRDIARQWQEENERLRARVSALELEIAELLANVDCGVAHIPEEDYIHLHGLLEEAADVIKPA